ncbi:hypothetical protein BY996DRAFT_6707378 [Phakopsora pachyrhizi]|uniref:Essential protein Yae1 N-terminal domain-containing protein n=1 Tax=Phakopsora pachyrhizi TaxID=170000 RepID=A0AAV0B044_PHAPC|nr:hypothetical protein BY996DRAFT_6707378 [Phakopsora pachyrhizi]CAH7675448.1 hypothetical protein PPACK8108_LOCUS10464 [Phakopsora pachyrhizi]
MESIDSLNHLEEQFYLEGYELGLKEGEAAGRLEGFQIGQAQGFKMFEEIGFYMGQARIWNQTVLKNRKTAQSKNDRTQVKVDQLVSLLEKFPMSIEAIKDPNMDFNSRLNNIRAIYRLCCANLGVKPRLQENTQLSL